MTRLLPAGPELSLGCAPPAGHPKPDRPAPRSARMTPLLAAGPTLRLACTPPAVQSPTTFPSPRSPR
jgi:hypothetical protein